MSGHTVLAGEAENKALVDAGNALWAAMERVIDSNPFYNGMPPIERRACIGRLAIQAFAEAVVAHTDGAAPQTYVLVTSMGRFLGQLAYGQPALDSGKVINLLQEEMITGHKDVSKLLKPAGTV